MPLIEAQRNRQVHGLAGPVVRRSLQLFIQRPDADVKIGGVNTCTNGPQLRKYKQVAHLQRPSGEGLLNAEIIVRRIKETYYKIPIPRKRSERPRCLAGNGQAQEFLKLRSMLPSDLAIGNPRYVCATLKHGGCGKLKRDASVLLACEGLLQLRGMRVPSRNLEQFEQNRCVDEF